MSAPVDVLAVMDRCISQARGVALDHSGSLVLANHWTDAKEARAAVAELIAAVRRERDELREVDSGLRLGHTRSRLERVLAMTAALARCGGAK
jgi:hypothetical protein